jgi:hypothetical protein
MGKGNTNQIPACFCRNARRSGDFCDRRRRGAVRDDYNPVSHLLFWQGRRVALFRPDATLAWLQPHGRPGRSCAVPSVRGLPCVRNP